MHIHRPARALQALATCLFALLALLPSAPSPASAQEAAKKQRAERAGKLVCLGCHLEKEFGAEAQCTLHSKHAQGFLADDGAVYTLLDNARGHLLITDRKLATGLGLLICPRSDPRMVRSTPAAVISAFRSSPVKNFE